MLTYRHRLTGRDFFQTQGFFSRSGPAELGGAARLAGIRLPVLTDDFRGLPDRLSSPLPSVLLSGLLVRLAEAQRMGSQMVT